MLKEQGKRLQLRFNIPNIPENKRNVERMLKQSLKAFKLFQHRFNFASTRFNSEERGWQTLSTLPFNKIESMLKQMLKPFARAFTLVISGASDIFSREGMLLLSISLSPGVKHCPRLTRRCHSGFGPPLADLDPLPNFPFKHPLYHIW